MYKTTMKYLLLTVIFSTQLSLSAFAMDNYLENVPTSKLPALLKDAKQYLKEERKEARQTGEYTSVEIAQDRVNNIKNEMQDRKEDKISFR